MKMDRELSLQVYLFSSSSNNIVATCFYFKHVPYYNMEKEASVGYESPSPFKLTFHTSVHEI
jgi:hypothetical protein